MAKKLFLVRHAEASPKLTNQDDKDRELTTAGKRQSVEIGTYLRQEHATIDVMITSSATRAIQTINLAADKMLFDTGKIQVEDRIYEASTRTFFEFINTLDNNLTSVLFVGHNPTLSYLAEYFTKTQIGSMTPGSLAVIKFETNSWKQCDEGTGQLIKYVTPSH